MKMCRYVRKMIIDYYEGSLPDNEMERIQKHLAECESCQAGYSAHKKLCSLLDSDEIPLPAPGVFDGIRRRSRQHAWSPSRSRRLGISRIIRILLPAGITVLLAIMIFWPRNGTVELSVSSSDLLQDEDIADMTLPGVVNEELISDFVVVERYLPSTIDDMLSEFTDSERDEFIRRLYLEYGESITPQIL